MSTLNFGDQVVHRFLPAGMSGAGYFVKLLDKGHILVTNYDPRNGEYPRCREGSYQTTWSLRNTRRVS